MLSLPRRFEAHKPSSLPPGLRGYWPLDEQFPGPIAVDYSGYRSHGTKVGTTVGAGLGKDGRPVTVFNGTSSDYITLGVPKAVGLKAYTIACCFYRTGAGATFSTGTGGLTMYPLVTHGLGEADGDNRDLNWALGVVSSTGVPGCDFESYNASPNNNPVSGATATTTNVWYHIAGTFDGFNHRIYLNGKLDGTVSSIQTPRSDSIQHVGIGTAMSSTGARTGFFQGRIQDAMVFDRALSIHEIVAISALGFGRKHQPLPSSISTTNRRRRLLLCSGGV